MYARSKSAANERVEGADHAEPEDHRTEVSRDRRERLLQRGEGVCSAHLRRERRANARRAQVRDEPASVVGSAPIRPGRATSGGDQIEAQRQREGRDHDP